MLSQKRTQVHGGEHIFLQQGIRLKRAQLWDILLGIALRFRSR